VAASLIAWTNQPVLLYHGTLSQYRESILAGIDLTKSLPYTDFGLGFYTTTSIEAAIRRAKDKQAIMKATMNIEDKPMVIRYEVERNALAQLECLWFVNAHADAVDFWSFVYYCRDETLHSTGHNRKVGNGYYDIVIGAITDDWRQRTILPNSDQVSFHTPQAIALLHISKTAAILAE
jgi:hypothetical protein